MSWLKISFIFSKKPEQSSMESLVEIQEGSDQELRKWLYVLTLLKSVQQGRCLSEEGFEVWVELGLEKF